MRVYLDHNATSPLRPEAKAAMVDVLDMPLNASSVHNEGRRGRKVIEEAREKVAALVGADPKAVTFTGSGTEANNTVLQPTVQFGSDKRTFGPLFVSSVEHPCVLAGGQFASGDIHAIPVDENGLVDQSALRGMLAPHDNPYVSVMLANNETGVFQPIDEIAGIVHDADGFLHVDAVQAAGKQSIDIFELEADVMTLSAHKIGGPQGVGAIVRRLAGTGIPALLRGGGQELGYRAGTENIAGIAGFGAAAEATLSQGVENLAVLQGRLESGLKALSNTIEVFGENVPRLANTTCFAMQGRRAEMLLIAYDMAGISVSSGSACSSGKVGSSHVLEAMGVEADRAAGALRVSTGWNTCERDIDLFLAETQKILER